MTDKQAQECLCTGCQQHSKVRVHFIGDIMICPGCIHLLMNIVENEAPEAVTWAARTPSPGMDKQAVIAKVLFFAELIEKQTWTEFSGNELHAHQVALGYCRSNARQIIDIIRQLPYRELGTTAPFFGITHMGDSSATIAPVLDETTQPITPANSREISYRKCKYPENCDYPDCGTRTNPSLKKCPIAIEDDIMLAIKCIISGKKWPWDSEDLKNAIVDAVRPYLATWEPVIVSLTAMEMLFIDAYSGILHVDYRSNPDVINALKAVLDSLKAQGVEMKYD